MPLVHCKTCHGRQKNDQGTWCEACTGSGVVWEEEPKPEQDKPEQDKPKQDKKQHEKQHKKQHDDDDDDPLPSWGFGETSSAPPARRDRRTDDADVMAQILKELKKIRARLERGGCACTAQPGAPAVVVVNCARDNADGMKK